MDTSSKRVKLNYEGENKIVSEITSLVALKEYTHRLRATKSQRDAQAASSDPVEFEFSFVEESLLRQIESEDDFNAAFSYFQGKPYVKINAAIVPFKPVASEEHGIAGESAPGEQVPPALFQSNNPFIRREQEADKKDVQPVNALPGLGLSKQVVTQSIEAQAQELAMQVMQLDNTGEELATSFEVLAEDQKTEEPSLEKLISVQSEAIESSGDEDSSDDAIDLDKKKVKVICSRCHGIKISAKTQKPCKTCNGLGKIPLDFIIEKQVMESSSKAIQDVVPLIKQQIQKECQEQLLNSSIVSAQQDLSVSHASVRCNNCKQNPLLGTRFKCLVCVDFNLCQLCELHQRHMDTHPMIIIKKPELEVKENSLPDFDFSVVATNFNSTYDVTCGVKFSKIWRLKNTGRLQWPHGTRLVRMGIESLNGASSSALCLIQPGQEQNLRIDFEAPEVPQQQTVNTYRMIYGEDCSFGNAICCIVNVVSTVYDSQVPTQMLNVTQSQLKEERKIAVKQESEILAKLKKHDLYIQQLEKARSGTKKLVEELNFQNEEFKMAQSMVKDLEEHKQRQNTEYEEAVATRDQLLGKLNLVEEQLRVVTEDFDGVQNKVNDYEQILQQKKEELAEYQEKNGQSSANQADLEKQIAELEHAMDQSHQDMKQANSKFYELEEQNQRLVDQIKHKEEETEKTISRVVDQERARAEVETERLATLLAEQQQRAESVARELEEERRRVEEYKLRESQQIEKAPQPQLNQRLGQGINAIYKKKLEEQKAQEDLILREQEALFKSQAAIEEAFKRQNEKLQEVQRIQQQREKLRSEIELMESQGIQEQEELPLNRVPHQNVPEEQKALKGPGLQELNKDEEVKNDQVSDQQVLEQQLKQKTEEELHFYNQLKQVEEVKHEEVPQKSAFEDSIIVEKVSEVKEEKKVEEKDLSKSQQDDVMKVAYFEKCNTFIKDKRERAVMSELFYMGFNHFDKNMKLTRQYQCDLSVISHFLIMEVSQ